MTRAQAWREVARRITEGEHLDGICNEVVILYTHCKISRDTRVKMLIQVRSHILAHTTLDERWAGWAYPPGEEREARILAALWMAMEATENIYYTDIYD